MNKYRIKAFGITRELLGGREATIEIKGETVGDLRSALSARFPELGNLRSLLIAVNNDYAEDDVAISPADEIALIPPVSGG